MKKYIQITIVLALFFLLALFRRANNLIVTKENISTIDSATQQSSYNNSNSNFSISPERSTPNNISKETGGLSSADSLPSIKTNSKYNDGKFTGSIEKTPYGDVQVEVTIVDEKISDIVFLKYPSIDNASRYLNIEAMPQLKSEAISSQGAKVDGVSGASETSQSFRDSLGDALVQATL